MRRAFVTGAGGFIGWHLCKYLAAHGWWVCGLDKKMPDFDHPRCDVFKLGDLRDEKWTREALGHCENAVVFHLAADMGGIGYITSHAADCALNNSRIDNAVISVLSERGCKGIVYASSACVYRQDVQAQNADHDSAPRLREDHDAWPADPEPGYGFQKLYTEKLLEYCHAEGRIKVAIARLHNVYGDHGTFDGGREKAPAALCRKFVAADDGGTVSIWGDGFARRSFLHITDCCRGLVALCEAELVSRRPLTVNLGHEDDVTIMQLAELVRDISGKTRVEIRTQPAGFPEGVRSRSCDGSKALTLLGWRPEIALRDGLKITYEWIEAEVNERANRGR